MTCHTLSKSLRDQTTELRQKARAVKPLFELGWTPRDLRKRSIGLSGVRAPIGSRRDGYILTRLYSNSNRQLEQHTTPNMDRHIAVLLGEGLLDHVESLAITCCNQAFDRPTAHFSLARAFPARCMRRGALPSLRKLNLEGNDLYAAQRSAPSGLSALCAALQRGALPQLEALRLRDTGLDDDGVHDLAAALVKGGGDRSLLVLDLSNNAVLDLSPLYPFPALRHLSLRHNFVKNWNLTSHPDFSDFAAAVGETLDNGRPKVLPALKSLVLSPVLTDQVPLLKSACGDAPRHVSCEFGPPLWFEDDDEEWDMLDGAVGGFPIPGWIPQPPAAN